MAKITRAIKAELYSKWVAAGQPSAKEYSSTIGVKESLMERVIREGGLASIRNRH